jgi:hypothetical protein
MSRPGFSPRGLVALAVATVVGLGMWTMAYLLVVWVAR